MYYKFNNNAHFGCWVLIGCNFKSFNIVMDYFKLGYLFLRNLYYFSNFVCTFRKHEHVIKKYFTCLFENINSNIIVIFFFFLMKNKSENQILFLLYKNIQLKIEDVEYKNHCALYTYINSITSIVGIENIGYKQIHSNNS